jgi:hypothetical protein
MNKPDESYMESVIAQWERTGLLNGLTQPLKHTMVCILENQRCYNQQMDDFILSAWKRNTIPLLRTVVPELIEEGINITSEVTFKYGLFNIIDPQLEFKMYFEGYRPKFEQFVNMMDYEYEYRNEFKEQLKASLKKYMTENNYKNFNFKALGWFFELNKIGPIAFYGDFS